MAVGSQPQTAHQSGVIGDDGDSSESPPPPGPAPHPNQSTLSARAGPAVSIPSRLISRHPPHKPSPEARQTGAAKCIAELQDHCHNSTVTS
ncbi:protein of unknown function [Rhodovastum atsumiense]|nr:protein of unknown function [Rhodovastum atsumiense]